MTLRGSSSPSSNPGAEGTPTQQSVNPSTSNDAVEIALASIRQKVFSQDRNNTTPLARQAISFWHLSCVELLSMFFSRLEVSTMIWACPGPGRFTVAWLAVLICVVGPLRAGYESRAFAATETIHISKACRTMETGITGYWNTLTWNTLTGPQPLIVILRQSPSTSSSLSRTASCCLFLRRACQLGWLLLLLFYFSGTVGP